MYTASQHTEYGKSWMGRWTEINCQDKSGWDYSTSRQLDMRVFMKIRLLYLHYMLLQEYIININLKCIEIGMMPVAWQLSFNFLNYCRSSFPLESVESLIFDCFEFLVHTGPYIRLFRLVFGFISVRLPVVLSRLLRYFTSSAWLLISLKATAVPDVPAAFRSSRGVRSQSCQEQQLSHWALAKWPWPRSTATCAAKYFTAKPMVVDFRKEMFRCGTQ